MPEGRVRRILPSPGPVRLLFLRGEEEESGAGTCGPGQRYLTDSGRCPQCRSGFEAGCQWRMRRRKQSGRREQGCTMSRPLNRDFRCLEVLQINAGGSGSHLEGIGVGVNGTVRPPSPPSPPNLAWACTGSTRKRPRATRPKQLVWVERYNTEDYQRHTPRRQRQCGVRVRVRARACACAYWTTGMTETRMNRLTEARK